MQDAIILYENGKAIGGEGHLTDADDITFNNTGTDLVSENVESAIKEAYGKSAKSADLTSISESGTTASQAISAGTYFYLNGTLVRAKTAIASGATFTLNTNYEVVSDGALNESVIYSTNEHIVGKWIDGSDLYEKTIDCGTLPNATSKAVTHGISNFNTMVSVQGISGSNDNTTIIPIPLALSGANVTMYVTNTKIVIITASDRTNFTKTYVTIRYTKTS